ncbi:GntR family transcriptional regulator [Gemmatimonas sp.]|uniref:GntR family transcriptional regulator n=1 Tax=Gemmatimonas sp. TaxID=1962908 RepID=UPI00356360EC
MGVTNSDLSHHSPMASKVSAPSAPSISLAEKAYRQLKERILTLQLRPGMFLNELALSEMLGIGRMPVHQAVHRLKAEGLVEVIPRKGLVIRPDSLKDMLSLLEARLAMEPNITALAAERASKEQIAALKNLVMESKRIVSQTERMSFMTLDRAFHSLIGEAAGNKILADAQRPLHERSELIWHLRVMREDGLVVNQNEHMNIFSAIAERDAKAARKAMEEHLHSLHNRILNGSLNL